MATQIHYFRGKALWAKLGLGPKPEENADKEYEAWKIGVALDEESKAAFSSSGLRLQFKNDDEFGDFITFRREFTRMFTNRDTGEKELVKFDPPVVSMEGSVFKDYIGNGSDVVVKVAVYDAGKYKGHRLEAVQVLELVEYDKAGASGPLVISGKEILPF